MMKAWIGIVLGGFFLLCHMSAHATHAARAATTMANAIAPHADHMAQKLIPVSNLPYLPGVRSYQTMSPGILHGVSVQTRSVPREILTDLRGAFKGGQMDAYNELIKRSLLDVENQLRMKAKQYGADAVIGVQFETSMTLGNNILVRAQGTPVKILDPRRSSVFVTPEQVSTLLTPMKRQTTSTPKPYLTPAENTASALDAAGTLIRESF